MTKQRCLVKHVSCRMHFLPALCSKTGFSDKLHCFYTSTMLQKQAPPILTNWMFRYSHSAARRCSSSQLSQMALLTPGGFCNITLLFKYTSLCFGTEPGKALTSICDLGLRRQLHVLCKFWKYLHDRCKSVCCYPVYCCLGLLGLRMVFLAIKDSTASQVRVSSIAVMLR